MFLILSNIYHENVYDASVIPLMLAVLLNKAVLLTKRLGTVENMTKISNMESMEYYRIYMEHVFLQKLSIDLFL